ncbi:MAG: hypothetical protein PSX36_13520 [bacterium]|nr:hypothetical protein [bacterium]
MEDDTVGNARVNPGTGLGIAGLVLGIIALVFAFIPCIGLFSLLPGIVGLILSLISFNQSKKARASRSTATAGLVCSLVACALACWQLYVLSKASTGFMQSYEYYEQSTRMDSLSSAIQTLEVVADTTHTEEQK